ncbi:hypothetical protein Ea357_117 [Erwinia phage Ea35-70]|uniref:Uncharacterized protein n=2 Tax=Agricanvirus TaxID=1984776 RepID=W6AR96_9CAUD|nr:hypothetical protein Ea357_117 [Erwinia phage Ea35-70]YP_009605905.1 hypothetical protein FDH99_gp121 [Erwinia phage vB_EamM_Simmy50]AHI60268.1 hypothetical protein Ea357_117 [Erwinia phage Ea35-70]ANH51583.1 hypothetical protein SIMMY50_121 [Erwinia phage vB_EamM_Simmy50]
MSDVIVIPRLSVVKGGSYQQVSGGVLAQLRLILGPDIRNVVLHGAQRSHAKLLVDALRAEYEPFGVTLQFNAKPLYDTLDISWPDSDAVTILTLRPEEFDIEAPLRLSHDTHIVVISTKPILTTQLLNLYDHAVMSGVHVTLFTTGYVPAGIVLLEPLEGFVYQPMIDNVIKTRAMAHV